MVDGSSRLLDLDGVIVESVQRLDDGTRLVQVLTAPEWVGICPECGERSTRSKGCVHTGPRDVAVGPDARYCAGVSESGCAPAWPVSARCSPSRCPESRRGRG